jgi:hypothetical protein
VSDTQDAVSTNLSVSCDLALRSVNLAVVCLIYSKSISSRGREPALLLQRKTGKFVELLSRHEGNLATGRLRDPHAHQQLDHHVQQGQRKLERAHSYTEASYAHMPSRKLQEWQGSTPTISCTSSGSSAIKSEVRLIPKRCSIFKSSSCSSSSLRKTLSKSKVAAHGRTRFSDRTQQLFENSRQIHDHDDLPSCAVSSETMAEDLVFARKA